MDVADAACPVLGLVGDRASHFTFAHPQHRCFSAPKSEVVAPREQRRYCLTADFEQCERYVAWRQETEAGRALLLRELERAGTPPEAPEPPAREPAPPTVAPQLASDDLREPEPSTVTAAPRGSRSRGTMAWNGGRRRRKAVEASNTDG